MADEELSGDDMTTETEVVDEVTETNDAPVTNEAPIEPVGETAADDGSQPDNSWQQPYIDLGFENLESPEDAQKRVLESLRNERLQRQEAQRQAQYFQAAYANHTSQAPQSTAQPEPEPKAPASVFAQIASDWPEIAQDEIEPFVERDSNGRAVGWKANTPPSVIEKSNAYIRARQKWDEIVQDPRRMSEAIEQHFQSMLDSHLDGRLQQREQLTVEQRAEQDFMQQNADWMYEKDPYTGLPSFTQPSAAGRQFYEVFEATQSQYGVSNMVKRIELASRLFQAQQAATGSPTGQPQAPAAHVPHGQPQAPARPTAADARRTMLGQRNGNPARPTAMAGVSDGPGGQPAGASRMSYGQSVVNGMKQEGLL